MTGGKVARVEACRLAMTVLAGGRTLAGEAGWRAALGHAGTCPACRDRLARLAEGIQAGGDEALPCAECQAGLPAFLALQAAGEDAAEAYTRVARHLAACPRCRAVAALLVPTLAPEGWAELPEPGRYPRFDTRFLGQGASIRAPELGDRLAAWWARLAGPRSGRPSESPVSFGLLGLGAVAILVLAVVAGAWALFRPEPLPLPIAPRATRAAASGTPATATPTPTVTVSPTPRRVLATPPAAAPSAAARPSARPSAATEPAAEPSERPRRTSPPPTQPVDGPTGEPPYPPPDQPTQGPTEDPYPGQTVPAEPSASPGP